MATVTIPIQRFGPGKAVNIQPPLQLRITTKISDLKTIIRSRTNIHPSDQVLVEKATMKRLDENDFLSRYTQGGTFEVYLLEGAAFQIYYKFNLPDVAKPVWVFPSEKIEAAVARIIDDARQDKNYLWTANNQRTSSALVNNNNVSGNLAAGDTVLMVRGAYGG